MKLPPQSPCANGPHDRLPSRRKYRQDAAAVLTETDRWRAGEFDGDCGGATYGPSLGTSGRDLGIRQHDAFVNVVLNNLTFI